MRKNNYSLFIFNTIFYIAYGSILTALGFLLFAFQSNYPQAFVNSQRIVSGVTFFILLILLFIEIIAKFFDKNASLFTLIAAFGIFVSFGLTDDFLEIVKAFMVLEKNDVATYAINYARNIIISISLIFVFLQMERDHNYPLKKNIRIIGGIILTTLALLSFLRVVNNLLFVAFVLTYLSLSSFYHIKFKKFDFNYYMESIVLFVLSSLLLLSFFETTIKGDFLFLGLPSICYLIVFTSYALVYVHFIANKTRESEKKEEIENRLNELQISILKNQMSPHFIFNSLQFIKATYRQDRERGEEALDKIAAYLRNYTEAAKLSIVPFDKELQMINNFISAINMKTERRINVLFNVDSYDFEVPYFGLQPYVENAILYSKINEKEDGILIISSYEDDNNYYIEVKDNGVGFDSKNIKETSFGINNSIERFKLSLNAETEIESIIGSGTTIKIRIPKK